MDEPCFHLRLGSVYVFRLTVRLVVILPETVRNGHPDLASLPAVPYAPPQPFAVIFRLVEVVPILVNHQRKVAVAWHQLVL